MNNEFFIKRYWHMLRKPASVALGLILVFGFVAGILFWGGFHTVLEKTATEEFCISCHEMKDNPYAEYKTSVHYQNHAGVKATCADCHLPKELGPEIVRKVEASMEVLGHMTGKIDTREKFLNLRKEMAEREWSRMRANDSQACRNCHNFKDMDFSQQASLAMRAHQHAEQNGQTCIDCHKGIAHQLPEMTNEEFGGIKASEDKHS